jgi:hypothetical protein
MGGVASAVSSVVGGAVDAVGDAVEDVGDVVVDDIVKPVAKSVDNTVQAAVNDPMGTLAMVTTAIVAPELLPAVSAANTVAHGGSLEKAAFNAGTSYLGGQVGAEVSGDVASAADSQFAGNVAGGATAGATTAGLRGTDMTQGALSGGLSGGIKSGAQEISDQNLADYSQQQAAKAYDNAPSPTEQDVLAADPSIPLPSPLSTPPSGSGQGYYDETTGEYITGEGGGLQKPLDDTSGTNQMSDETPISGESSGQEAQSGSDLTNGDGSTPDGYNPSLTTKQMEMMGNFAKNAILNAQHPKTRTAGTSRKGTTGAGDVINGFDFSVPWLNSGSSYLESKKLKTDDQTSDASTPDENLNDIYTGITPELQDEFASRGIGTNILTGGVPRIAGLGGGMMSFASGGSSSCCSSNTSMGSLAGNMAQYMPKFATPYTGGMLPTVASNKRQPFTTAALKQLQSHISNYGNMGGMAQGGLPAKYEHAKPDGHNPEFVTGLTGYYACGGGTGQSDDIPAMLHDGDYVMDAETVSALGDGSSKAGRAVLEGFQSKVPHKDDAGGKPVPAKIADGEYVFPAAFVTALGHGDNKHGAEILDGLRERLRAHKRSAPDTKIPPKAKSPLDYIKGMKG